MKRGTRRWAIVGLIVANEVRGAIMAGPALVAMWRHWFG